MQEILYATNGQKFQVVDMDNYRAGNRYGETGQSVEAISVNRGRDIANVVVT